MSEQARHTLHPVDKPVIDKIKLRLYKSIAGALPKSKLGIALYYLQSQWPSLIRYIDDGGYPIDNNPEAQNFLGKFWTALVGRVATNLRDEVSTMRFARL
jgi:Transposase IS66 family